MKLIKFYISNFRGLPSLEIELNGKDANIYGRNGAGKSTVFDGFLWLLFGKDSSNRRDYDLTPHKLNLLGAVEPDVGVGKEPTIEAELEHNGVTIKLKKASIEEWPKKGELKGAYAGSKIHYYVDNLEIKAGEYQQVVSELIEEGLFKLITDPQYFSVILSWQDRRAVLIKIAGELSVKPSPELSALMADRPFDKFYELSKQQVKKYQKDLDGIPVAIREAARMIPAELPVVIDTTILEGNIITLNERILALKNNDATNTLRSQIASIELQMAEARNQQQAATDAKNAKIRLQIATLETERQEKRKLSNEADSKILQAEYEIETFGNIKTAKLQEWHTVNKLVWTGSDTCPTCGQDLPTDQVETARIAFNLKRSTDLETLKADGLALKKSIEEMQVSVAELQKAFDTLVEEIAVLDQRIIKGQSLIKSAVFDSTEYDQQIAELRAAPVDASKGDADAMQESIREMRLEVENSHRAKLVIEQAAVQQKRVDELKQSEVALNTELNSWEGAVSLCQQHVKNSAKALETAVNGKFKIARFQLFATQKNGEEVETCDIIYPNGSTNLSTGERLQTGIDIINTLTAFYGVDAPIFIDNAESISLPYETKSQVIRLIVSPEDKILRVEVEK